MALRCFSLAVVAVGITCPRCCNRLAAASKVMLCSDVIGSLGISAMCQRSGNVG